MNKIYVRLAKTNMRNNRQLYVPYILSGLITVAMFYLMTFLSGNEGLAHARGAEMIGRILSFGVGIIGIFSYIFIFYTNSFISKRRKKEIGIYNILGMEKRHIGKVLAIETLYTSVLAIGGGIIGGIIFSKLMLMFLYRILDITTSVSFEISWQGIEYTIVLFGILYFLTFLYNYMQMKLANPMELLRGGNVGEKEPKTKVLMTLAGMVCLGIGYYIAFTTENPLKVLTLFFLAVVLVIIGTYFLFIAGSIALLKLMRKNKKFYYNKKHFTAVSGMLYRMKQNAAGLASICILSTMVLVVISMTVSMFAGIGDELLSRYPNEINVYSYEKTLDDNELKNQEEIAAFIEKSGRKIEKKVGYSYLSMLMQMQGDKLELPSDTSVDKYTVNMVTRENFLAMQKVLGKKDVPEVAEHTVAIYGSKWNGGKTVTILGEKYKVAKTHVHELRDAYTNSEVQGAYYIIVDSEKTVEELFEKQKKLLGDHAYSFCRVSGYEIDGTKAQKVACEEKLGKLIEKQNENRSNLENRYVEGRLSHEQNFYTIYGGLFFLGIFLGSMFLMVTVMIIFYKQISEGYDDRQRYEIMEKVGMSNQEVKVSIQSQVRIVFFLPLVMAAIHVTAAFPMIRRLLVLLNLSNTGLFVKCLVITLLVFMLIYYLVFRLTSRAYYRIVGNQVNK